MYKVAKVDASHVVSHNGLATRGRFTSTTTILQLVYYWYCILLTTMDNNHTSDSTWQHVTQAILQHMKWCDKVTSCNIIFKGLKKTSMAFWWPAKATKMIQPRRPKMKSFNCWNSSPVFTQFDSAAKASCLCAAPAASGQYFVGQTH